MLTIQIGRDSNNQVHEKQLADLPHLYISYSDEQHLLSFLNSLTKNISNSDSILSYFLLSNISRSINLSLLSNSRKKIFWSTATDEDNGKNSRNHFFKNLLGLMNSRIKLLKEANSLTYHEYNVQAGKRTLQPIVVFIDDVYRLLLPSRKNTSLQLVKLLLAGDKTGIHCIVASTGSYKYLINQLLNINIKSNRKLAEFIKANGLATLPPLAAELIITPENFVFYKAKDVFEYERLYAL